MPPSPLITLFAAPPADQNGAGGPDPAAADIGRSGLFDAAYYLLYNQDVAAAGTGALAHFLDFGWREDRRPNPFFHPAWYIAANPDAAAANPLAHYIAVGDREGRRPCPYFDSLWYRARYDLPAEVNALAHYLAHRASGEVSPIPEFDNAFYIATNPDVATAGGDPFEHFLLHGFREGRNPSRDFCVRDYAARHLDGALTVNPLLHDLLQRPVLSAGAGGAGVSCTRFSTRFLFAEDPALTALRHASAGPPAVEQQAAGLARQQLVAAEFDRDYYLATNHDVRDSGRDPLEHYLQSGWREQRRPAPWFDTVFYLAAYPDVRDAADDPFWHFLAAGRAEGRRPAKSGGYRREIIDNLVAPHERSRDYVRSPPAATLAAAFLAEILAGRLRAGSGLVLSVSHDCYIRSLGGVQIFLADEQAGYAGRGMIYLNISPFHPDLVLAAPAAEAMLELVLDGAYLGVVSAETLTAVVGRLQPRRQEARMFIVHCLLGHQPEALAALQAALAPQRNYFWLHDFSSVCEGFNLLRNNVAFCAGPPADSLCCRVCIHGGNRRRHLQRVHDLFAQVPFTVVAPSVSALKIWSEASDLPHRRAVVHAHCKLEEAGPREAGPREAGPREAAGTAANPVRLAFIGHPVAHKGWPAFLELAAKYGGRGCYKFFHFTSEADGISVRGVTRVVARTTPQHRDAMIDALAEHLIDIVVVLAPWPETFSYVAFEALAAGADILTTAASGNVADVVLNHRRGIVVANDAALHDLFEELRLIRYVRICQAQGRRRGRLSHIGTTATLDVIALAQAAAE